MTSNRNFGLFFTLFLTALATYLFFKKELLLGLAFLLVAFILLIFSIKTPNKLARLNQSWFKLGLIMGKFVSPIALGFIFFVVITPIGLFMRLCGRDAFLLKRKKVESYWINRSEKKISDTSFTQQF